MYKVKKNGVVYLTNYKPVDSNITDFNDNSDNSSNSDNGFESENDNNDKSNTQDNNDKKNEDNKQNRPTDGKRKLVEFYLVMKDNEAVLEKRCSICNEVKPKGISLAMFIAKHKCFKEDIEVRVIDSKDRAWKYVGIKNEGDFELCVFECMKCKDRINVDTKVSDETMLFGLDSSHECS